VPGLVSGAVGQLGTTAPHLLIFINIISDDGSPDVDPGMLAKLARPVGYLHPYPTSDDAGILDGKAREAQDYKQELANRESIRRTGQ
jgi:hypothetical protein